MIARLRLLPFGRRDPGLDRANRIMSGAKGTPTSIRKRQIGVRVKKRIEFDLNFPCNQPASAGSRNFVERIIDFVFLPEMNDSILVHGATYLGKKRLPGGQLPGKWKSLREVSHYCNGPTFSVWKGGQAVRRPS